MSNKRITELSPQSVLDNSDVFAVVDVSVPVTNKVTFDTLKENLPGSSTSVKGNSYLVPVQLEISGSSSSPYPQFSIEGDDFDSTSIIKCNWNGGNGTAHIVLGDATSDTNQYRFLRFIMNGNFSSNTKAVLMASSSQYLDNDLHGSGYTLQKSYEGIAVWSDGERWIRIQTKA